MPEAGSETLTKDHAEAEAGLARDAGQPGLSAPGVRAVAAAPQDAANPQAINPQAAGRRMTELRVSGHLMTLEDGLFCVFHSPGSSTAAADSGLPGVRISLGPGSMANPRAVEISTFRNDGWLSGNDDAALVRVAGGPAQVLVTVYQSARGREAPPKLQVIRLSQEAGVRAAAPVPQAAVAAKPMPPAPPPPADPGTEPAEIAAHVQIVGDCAAAVGQWIGERGSKRWIEGFSIAPRDIGRDDIEYQAVLGRGWVSPWVAGGAFCGSRGMALPVLGLRVRLRAAASAAFACSVSASFIDGTELGPVAEGEACEADSLAPLEAFQVVLTPRAPAPAAATAVEPPQAAPPPRPPKPSVPKPSVKAAVKAALVRGRQPAPVPTKPRGRR